MENQNNKPQDNLNSTQETVVEQFKGYTLDELRYNRAMIALKSEFCKEKILAELNSATNKSIIGKFRNGEGLGFFKSGVMTKIAKSLNYVDYLIVGATAFKAVKSISSIFKRNK